MEKQEMQFYFNYLNRWGDVFHTISFFLLLDFKFIEKDNAFRSFSVNYFVFSPPLIGRLHYDTAVGGSAPETGSSGHLQNCARATFAYFST